MSRENVEVVRNVYEALGSAELDAVTKDAWHPEIQWHASEGIGVLHGRTAVLGFIADWFETFDDFRVQADEIIDAGDEVVAVVRMTGRGKGSGAAMNAHYAVVFAVHSGRVVRAREYATRAEALEAAGLRE